MASAGFSLGGPGFTADRESVENDVFFQTSFIGTPLMDALGYIDSTATDAGHTSYTLQLRPGLVMAKLASNGNWVAYSASAVDGSQVACGVLCREVYMLDFTTSAAAARNGLIAVAGNFKAAGANLIGLDQQARCSLKRQGFNFDDGPTVPADIGGHIGVNKITGTTYTATAADFGKIVTLVTSGDCTVTLPVIAVGAVIEFLNCADHGMTITSAETANMITVNSLVSTSVAFTTGSEKVGARLRVEAIYVSGTLKWLATSTGVGTIVATVSP